MKKTVLNQAHRDLNARMVPFGEWDMPVNYGSQIEEHHAVRQDAGMFDVSHMQAVDLSGVRVRDLLQHLLANDVAKLKNQGKALYSCMLNEKGGVIDDLIVYFMQEDWFRLVVNAGTAEKDISWIKQHAPDFGVAVNVRDDLAMIAIQGPNAREKALPLIAEFAGGEISAQAGELKPFNATGGDSWFIGRTGYTGEDGFEVLMPQQRAVEFWNALKDAGVRPCGLGARDTLRLEAGMNLYGSDMDEEVSPLEAGLAWTLALDPEDRDFVGRKALEALKLAGNLKKFTGLILEGRGVLRDHQKLFEGETEVGEITSGGFSPTLNKAIAFARVAADAGENLQVDIRGKRLPVIRVKLPFARAGKACY
jgi:aminomethyltransferase